MPAVDWWPILTSASPSSLIDILKSSREGELEDLLLSGQITSEELEDVFIDTIEEATGRPFQAALILALFAQEHWIGIGARLAERGFRWDVLPIGAALDAVYGIIVNALEEKPRKKFLALLDKPMPGRRREVDREKVVSQFEAIAGPKPTTGVVAKGTKPPTSGVRSSGEPSGSARPRTPTRPRRPRPGVRSSGPKPPPA